MLKRSRSGTALPKPIREMPRRLHILVCLRRGRNTTRLPSTIIAVRWRLNPDLPGLQMNLGLALFKAAQFPDAIRIVLVRDQETSRRSSRLTILLGMAHYGMKDYLVAIPYLKRATEHDPQNVTLRMTLAHSCISSEQYQCVLDVHKEILALNAESAEADMLAAEAFDQMGDSAAAKKQFRAAILKNSSEPSVHFGLGYLLWSEGRWSEAANEFLLELQNDPNHTRARIYLADPWCGRLNLHRLLRNWASSLPTNNQNHLCIVTLASSTRIAIEVQMPFENWRWRFCLIPETRNRTYSWPRYTSQWVCETMQVLNSQRLNSCRRKLTVT